jgi:PDZ domain-containing protein
VLEVDGRPATGGARLRELITARDPGEPVDITVRRDGQQLETTITTADADGRAIVGILTRDEADYPFSVEISLRDVGGPSAGLMFALGIVDKLTPGALTDGRFVAGTGTIDDEGNVGAIGGITQKMVGANAAGATEFLVPAGNCEEAVDTAPGVLRLVKVETLAGAVSALEALAKDPAADVPSCSGG